MTETKRVLVVDDEEDVLDLVGWILEDSGYQVEYAGRGDVALEKLDASRPNLMLLDLMLPGLDGWQVLDRLRERTDAPPVLVLSAHLDSRARRRAVEAGAVGCLDKPFQFQALVEACQAAL